MPIDDNLASDLRLIVPNLHRRYSGVTATNRMVAPKLAQMYRAAFARATDGGQRIALTGVAPTPVLVQPGDELDPVGDFRGSSDYRRALADVLMARVVERIS